MATRPNDPNPWPSQTPAPPPPSQDTYFSSTSDVEGRSVKRRRVLSSSLDARKEGSLAARQVIVDQELVDQARHDCQVFSGNEVISCFPTRDTSVPQHQWATFVWNSRRPELTQINRVDIFLFRGDSRTQVLNFTDVPNPTDQAGVVTARVDDRWFGRDGENFAGASTSYPFYWVVIRSDKTLDGNEIPQPTFTAIQTTMLDSVVAASSASAASASSLASASSASAASLSALSSSRVVTTINGTPTTLFPSSSVTVQSATSDDPFPRWAIAVIVILGFFAIAATGILIFFIIRRIRRRNNAELESNRNSMGSASPMMAKSQQESPLLGPSVLAASQIPPRPASLRRNDSHGAPSLHDGASGISGEGGPFSGQDAAIMADAFRKMLRKPDFAAVEEGESPESNPEGGPAAAGGVLSRELAEEGKDLRSVSSSRGVKVESHSDHGGDPQPR